MSYNFVETDSSKIYNAILGSLMDYCNEPLYPGDERRIFAEGLVLVLTSIFNEFNDKMKQRTLQQARGEILDAIGEMYNTERAEPSKASAVFRFSVATAMAENIVIPEGTRITSDGEAYFATTQAAVLQAGELTVDVPGEATEGGAKYNNFAPGTIATLVDLIPYITEVSNTTETAGGDDGEPYTEDGDNRYRSRIQLAFSQLSTAGPATAYKYFALSADPDIVDVGIEVPSACNVVLYPLMRGGALPDADTKAKVLAAVNADDVRPMTDLVAVESPTTVGYSISLKYYVPRGAEADAVQAIEGEGGAVDSYIAWQSENLGRDINPDELRYYLRQAGATRVEITAPAFAEVGATSVATLTGDITITHEVID